MSAKPVQVSEEKVANERTNQEGGKYVDGTSEVLGSLTPELVIALCGPIGSPLHQAADQIANTLRDFGYITESIRLSKLIRINAENVHVQVDASSRATEVQSLIRAGDELRREYGHDVLAKLAIAKISGDRRKRFGEFTDAANESAVANERKIRGHRICHIVDSVKNKAELDLLRLVYGDTFFAIGVFSPVEIRRRNMEADDGLRAEEIDALIDTDSGEEVDHGQSVRDTFPHCDFFVRIDSSISDPDEPEAVAQLVKKLRRFFRLIFRTAVVTPTTDETAMYSAASAARNSACLSRQVGAAVTTSEGEILSIGWNDVPRSGGGLYGKPPIGRGHGLVRDESLLGDDHRCFANAEKICHNDSEKRAIAAKVVSVLVDAKILNLEQQKEAVSAIISDTRIKDLIEFSRAVHAEMHAILGASRVGGDRILGGRLYVTTYPCHSCARHVVAAGISEVIYIEPYRKSLATRLHSDALTETVTVSSKVRLLQFDGIAPRRFIELFEAGKRKQDGVLNLLRPDSASPATRVSLRAIPRLEEVVVAEVMSRHLNFPELVTGGGSNDKSEPPHQAA